MKTCATCGEENSDRAQFCQVCGDPLGAQEAIVPQEVRKTISLVFCDLRGTSKTGDRLDPETMRGVIARSFEDAKAILERHGGTVEKFIGDAIMAAFGVPVLHEDDALRAVRAADELRDAAARSSSDLEAESGVALAVKIAVNTGEVIAGDPSAGHGFVSGDAVNVAARLEQAAQVGEVLIGEPTYRLVRDAVKVESVEPLELKGKAEPMPAYRLLDVIPDAVGTARRLDSPLVGREEQLGAMVKTLEDSIAAGECRLLTVLGAAGAGKSRLTGEFSSIAGEKARVVYGRCLPYGEGITFWPVAQAVKELCGITEDPIDAARAKIGALLPESDDHDLIVERIAAALGMSDVEGNVQETFWALRKLFEVVATRHPLVVVFDDLHWAQATLLDLLEYLVGFASRAPMMVLCLARPELHELRPTWGTTSPSLHLEPLGDDAIGLLIDNLLGQARLPAPVSQRITQAAEGNPLYVEEILRMLIDDGLLQRDNGHWSPVGNLSKLAIPSTISALISARLDRLTPSEQGVIHRASVIGKEFWWGAVADLSPEVLKERVGGHLQMLIRKEIIRSARSDFVGEDAFRFSHILIRDAAYNSIPKALRAQLHERFSDWLEAKVGEHLREYEEILGYHLEQAYRLLEDLGQVDDHARALADRAAGYLADAGSRALGRSDMPTAANLLARATSLLPIRDPRRLELSLDLADALMEVGRLKEAEAALDSTARAASVAELPALEARALVHRCFLDTFSGTENWDEQATSRFQELTPILRAEGDERGLTRAHYMMANVHWDNLNYARAEAELEQALDHARSSGHTHDQGPLLSALAACQFWGPAPVDKAMSKCHEILTSSKGHRAVEAGCIITLAGLHAMRAEFDDARRLVAVSRAINTELGREQVLADHTHHSGLVEMLAGDPVAAEREFRAGYIIYQRAEEWSGLATSAALLSEALLEQGRFDEALQETMVSEERWADPIEWGPTRARLLAHTGELEEAVKMATDVMKRVAETDDLRARGDSALTLAYILFQAGFNDDATLFADKALKAYQEKGVLPAIDEVKALLDLHEPAG